MTEEKNQENWRTQKEKGMERKSKKKARQRKTF